MDTAAIVYDEGSRKTAELNALLLHWICVNDLVELATNPTMVTAVDALLRAYLPLAKSVAFTQDRGEA
jgi:hypothetical protein